VSERETLDKATRRGRKAYWAGVPLEDNPMRGAASRYYWEQAWLEEQREDEARCAALERAGEKG
jgi:hypothetical protein